MERKPERKTGFGSRKDPGNRTAAGTETRRANGESRKEGAGRRSDRRTRHRERALRIKRRRRARRRFLMKTVLAAAACMALIFAGRAGWNYLQNRLVYSPEKLAEKGWPDSLIELLERNPETKEFVMGYQDYEGPLDTDVSGEVTKGEIPLFLQWDRRWGYETYGNDFLAVTGCGPVCLSMVLCGLTGDTSWNPLKTACWAEEQGYYVDGSGSSWSLMTDGAQSLGLTASEVVFDESHILAELEAGHPIICVVGPGDFTTSGHFLVLTGADDSGKILLHDPNSIIRSQKAWDLEQLMGQIRNLWSYSC